MKLIKELSEHLVQFLQAEGYDIEHSINELGGTKNSVPLSTIMMSKVLSLEERIEYFNTLLDAGVNVDYRVKLTVREIIYEVTPLFLCIYLDEVPLFAQFLSFLQDKNGQSEVDKNKIRFINYAVKFDSVNILRHLCDDNANWVDESGRTLLRLGCEVTASKVIYYAGGEDYNGEDQFGVSAIMYGIALGNRKTIELLFNKNIDLNRVDRFGNTPLNYAIKFKQSGSDCIQLLVNRGANINLVDERGNTPLRIAIQSQDKDLIKYLIKNNADLWKINNEELPLQFSLRLKLYEIARLLIDQMDQKLIEIINHESSLDAQKLCRLVLNRYSSELFKEKPAEEFMSKLRNDAKLFIEKTLNERLQKYRHMVSMLTHVKTHYEDDEQADKEMHARIEEIINVLVKYEGGLINFEKYLSEVDDEGTLTEKFKDRKYQLATLSLFDLVNKRDFRNANLLLVVYNLINKDFILYVAENYEKNSFSTILGFIFPNNTNEKFYSMLKHDKRCLYKFLKVLAGNGLDFSDKDLSGSSLLDRLVHHNDLRAFSAFASELTAEQKRIVWESQVSFYEKSLDIKSNDKFYQLMFSNDEVCETHTVVDDEADKENRSSSSNNETKENAEKKMNQQDKIIDINSNEMKFAKKLGHALGFDSFLSDFTLENKVEINGSDGFDGAVWLNEFMGLYLIHQNEDSYWQNIHEAFQAGQMIINSKLNLQELMKRYNNHKPITLFLDIGDHIICISLYQGYMAVTNRGDAGDDEYGTNIYKIGFNVEKTIKHLLTNLEVATHLGLTTKAESRYYILKLLCEPNGSIALFDRLDQKNQKHGTCGFVSPKSNTQGLYYLLELIKQLNGRNVDELSANELQKIKGECYQISKSAYKPFTNFIRDTALNDLILKFISAKFHKNNSKIYSLLLMTVLLEHHKFNGKNGQEGRRAHAIFSELGHDEREFIKRHVPYFEAEYLIYLKENFVSKKLILNQYPNIINANKKTNQLTSHVPLRNLTNMVSRKPELRRSYSQ